MIQETQLFLVSAVCAIGVVLLGLAVSRLLRRRRIQSRVRSLAVDSGQGARAARTIDARGLAKQLGDWLAQAGHPLHDLRAGGQRLEDVFRRLTSGEPT